MFSYLSTMHDMNPDWPLIAACILVLIKQALKLYVLNRPDFVGHIKALAALPLDVMFIITALFIRAASEKALQPERFYALILAYIFATLVSTLLWRLSDEATNTSLGAKFFFSFSTNASLSGACFYFASTLLG
jgi:hypothetical protein